MADSISLDDAEAFLAEVGDIPEEQQSDLVKRFRTMLAGRIEAAKGDAADAEKYRSGAPDVFTEAGIGTSPTEQLLRDKLAGTPGLTAEQVQAEAQKYGLATLGDEPPAAVPTAEAEALEVFNSNSQVPAAAPPDLNDQISNAESIEDVVKLVQGAGIEAENHNFHS